MVDINAAEYYLTPLMHAVNNNHPNVVKALLTSRDLKLDIADDEGDTALHYACDEDDTSSIIPLLGQDRRCTLALLNKRNEYGETPLMNAVARHNLECVKELDKLEGTNFRTENNAGETLLDVARGEFELIKYLVEKQKKETLAEKAAFHVAKCINNMEDVENLEIPVTLYSLVKKFFDH